MAAQCTVYWLTHTQATLYLFEVTRPAGPGPVFGDAVLAATRGTSLDEAARRQCVHVIPEAGSQRQRHIEAVRIGVAAGARYAISVDDDIWPRPEMDLDVAAALMDAHPEFWLAAVHLPSCHLPHGADGAHSAPIVERKSVV